MSQKWLFFCSEIRREILLIFFDYVDRLENWLIIIRNDISYNDKWYMPPQLRDTNNKRVHNSSPSDRTAESPLVGNTRARGTSTWKWRPLWDRGVFPGRANAIRRDSLPYGGRTLSVCRSETDRQPVYDLQCAHARARAYAGIRPSCTRCPETVRAKKIAFHAKDAYVRSLSEIANCVNSVKN